MLAPRNLFHRQPVAAALHAWVTAVLEHSGASAEASESLSLPMCSPAMQAAASCVCELNGMNVVAADELRSALLMAKAFPDPTMDAVEESEQARSLRLSSMAQLAWPDST